MIGFCVDSNSQVPDELVARYGVEVVPLRVSIDGRDYREGVDLGADEFYAHFASGSPQVTTAAPAPADFAAAYETLVAKGATEILSVHIGSAISATVNAARLASQLVGVPVRIVDTGEASFAIACALWEAAEAVAKGADLEEAATVAQAVGGRCGNVFVVKALELARAGGRLASGVQDDAIEGIPVLSMVQGRMTVVGSARTADDAADVMAGHIRASGTDLRVGIGVADAQAAPLWRALEDRLVHAPEVLDLVRYRIGPSVGAHTGPGTAGSYYYSTAI
ncbi:MAG: DegV family EDD domain-containing protein [Actinobacteria bacterium]|nr:DegV family EDD domain-containing protein [Actinomycetota bacterium]MBW3650685.1 DegV family EDD domain-containing protein [Actinomycetota bacterium]